VSEQKPTIPPDQGQWRQALIATLVMVAVSVLGYFALSGQIAQINAALDSGDGERAVWLSRRAGAVILIILMLAGFSLAYTLEKIARLSLQQGRYPPQEVKVLHNTPMRTGSALKAVVLIMRACAVALVLLSCGMTIWFGLALYRLF